MVIQSSLDRFRRVSRSPARNDKTIAIGAKPRPIDLIIIFSMLTMRLVAAPIIGQRSKIGGSDMIDRRTLSTMLIAGVATPLIVRSTKAQVQPAVSARNVVLVHGLFADGSCWSDGHRKAPAKGDPGHSRAEPADDAAETPLRRRNASSLCSRARPCLSVIPSQA